MWFNIWLVGWVGTSFWLSSDDCDNFACPVNLIVGAFWFILLPVCVIGAWLERRKWDGGDHSI